ncbi:MAG: BatA domain-containing protein [Planctomycetales bacterium]|nr:BatA domain-containing protein [Planctomycetales bacterium]
MQFLFQPLTWGFLLVGVPILIHLINMLRHRRQRWAAMDFLLESYRRNRRWVLLKQWLLLFARMLAMALLVTMLAKWVSAAKWLGWFGGQSTHHYILLDDSYSMGDTEGGEIAYDRALQAVSGLLRSIAGTPGQHYFTFLRWSRASLVSQSSAENAPLDAAADMIAVSIPQDPARLLDRVRVTSPTPLSLSPGAAIELVSPLIADSSDEQSIVYLVTDLRRNEFGDPQTLRNNLLNLTKNSGLEIQLIDCGKDSSGNLTLASVEPEKEIWAAGVPLMVRFQVRNHSAQVLRNLVVKLKAITYADGSVSPQIDRDYSGDILELPPIVIEQIAPGETVTRQTQVVFGVPGRHVVEVALPDDSVNTDNKRWCVIDIKPAQSVLVVDGELDQSNAFYFETVTNPDARLRTGLVLENADAVFLRDASARELAKYNVIVLLDVPRLEPTAIAKLEEYCRAGGGIFITTGPNTNTDFVNDQLYREGQGIFPLQIQAVDDLISVSGIGQPHVIATEHPILAPLKQLSSSPFSLINIRKILSVEPASLERPGLQIVATGISNRPILVDHPMGDGRVLTLLTGLRSEWSNWAQDPTFVVLILRSLGYLSSFRHATTSDTVGTSIEVVETDSTILPEAEIILPAKLESNRIRLLQNVDLSDPQVARLNWRLDLAEMDRDSIEGFFRPGLFEVWLVDGRAKQFVHNFAHNVAAVEGNLERVPLNELVQSLQPVPIQIRSADALRNSGLNAQNASHSTVVMALLIMLLLAEQILAYSASFHPHTPVTQRHRSSVLGSGGMR